MEKKDHIISRETQVMEIAAESEFNQLDKNEQEYSYYLYKACWEGTKICFFQKSWESPALFYILQQVFSQSLDSLRNACQVNGLNQEEFESIIIYCASFIQNCGNYKSFGDIKFVPDVGEDKFFTFIKSSDAFKYSNTADVISNLWEKIKNFIFNYEGVYKSLGLNPSGLSGYYSHDLKKEEVALVDEFLQIVKISPLNTRIGKISEKEYVVLIASANLRKKNTHFYRESKIHIVYGDYAPFLRKIANYFEKALEYAANNNQKKMIELYLEHFYNGDIDVHKDSQRAWVKDISPIIEHNIGFIETYMDPIGVRAEFEGWVAVVDKEQSRRTANLVSRADDLLKLSPWPKDFEKDKFLKPDFTALSVLAFGCGGTPLGINIPNYDDIRQEDGFKNVFLANNFVTMKKVNYMESSLGENFLKHYKANTFFKVAYHELLGHGCGKMLKEDKNGVKNFDENLINPVTKLKIETWYKSEDTWGSIFGKLSNPYEECRADSVALYYSCFEQSYDVLLPEFKPIWQELCLALFTEFVLQGLNSLEYYNIDSKSFGQAHMNGRYVILQVLLEAGNDFIKIQKTKNDSEGGKDWIYVEIDKNQILTTGRKALEDFLLKMNIFKATADYKRASEMFYSYSKFNEFFMELREIIIANKKPRRLEIQGLIERNLKENSLNYGKFPETFEGIIQSFQFRFPLVDNNVLEYWIEQSDYFRPFEISI